MFSKKEAMKAFKVSCDINTDDTPKTTTFYLSNRMISIIVYPSETKCGLAEHVSFFAQKYSHYEKYECETTGAIYENLDEMLKAVKEVEALYE